MKPVFSVSNIPVYGDLILSPMAGFSDIPFRSICREFGMAMSYTEVVTVDGILWRNKKTFQLLDYREVERPVVFQILGSDEDKIIEACRVIESLGPDIIDINMGCPVRDIAGKGAGAGLLKYPSKIGRIFRKLTNTLTIPVTAKIRLGWDSRSLNYMEVVKILEDNGASLVAVHGRTRAQAFCGKADWDAIAEIKQSLRIPVLGNGDVKSVADIINMKYHTHCDGVMIGRGAIGHPWIFRYKDRDQVPLSDKIGIMRRHMLHMVRYYGEEVGIILFRKHAAKYILGMPFATEARPSVVKCRGIEEMIQCIFDYTECIQNREIAV